jgi:carbon storage regulator CsrA
MLVLSRKSQESVVVGGADGFRRLVRVTVLEIKGRSVRLGFEADSDVPVHRLELWERIHASGPPVSIASGTLRAVALDQATWAGRENGDVCGGSTE